MELNLPKSRAIGGHWSVWITYASIHSHPIHQVFVIREQTEIHIMWDLDLGVQCIGRVEVIIVMDIGWINVWLRFKKMESRLSEVRMHYKAKVSSRRCPNVSAPIHSDNSCSLGLFSGIHRVWYMFIGGLVCRLWIDWTVGELQLDMQVVMIGHWRMCKLEGNRVPLVFKSPVRSGYWVSNMVTETLTG